MRDVSKNKGVYESIVWDLMLDHPFRLRSLEGTASAATTPDAAAFSSTAHAKFAAAAEDAWVLAVTGKRLINQCFIDVWVSLDKSRFRYTNGHHKQYILVDTIS